jgi:23S rRNA pseudouridine1911/1915/1917 synthase
VLVELLRDRGTSRAEIQRWMAEGKVLVGATAVRKSSVLAGGERIEIEVPPPPLSEARPDPSVVLEIVYEDAHLLVVDKPAGLVVHPSRGHATGTLVNGLLARGGFAADSADPRDPEGHLRPGIVHRLDKGTSGLLVVAKSAPCREGLKALFQRHDIERSYLALAVGRARAGHYDTPHGRHPTHRLKFTSLLDPASRAGGIGIRRARTDVEVVRNLEGVTLVRCTLHTGRTHQIRVHLAEQAKTPILGDPLYGPPPSDATLRRIGDELGRQALHAAVLGFVHPITKENLRWESPLPADIRRAIVALEALTTPST